VSKNTENADGGGLAYYDPAVGMAKARAKIGNSKLIFTIGLAVLLM
jgi:hypothetical protein